MDKNAKRFMPPLIDTEFKLNLIKKKKKNINENKFNLDDLGFKLNGGIYELTSPIKVDKGMAKATYDVIKVSFFGDNPKEIYYHYDIEITVEEQTLKMSAESRLVFSKHGQVSVTLPEIEIDPQ